MAKATLARKACSVLCAGALVLGGTGAVYGGAAMAPAGDSPAGVEQAQAKTLTAKQVKANKKAAMKRAVLAYLEGPYMDLEPKLAVKVTETDIVLTVSNIRVKFNGRKRLKYTYRGKDNKKVTEKMTAKQARAYKGTVVGTKTVYADVVLDPANGTDFGLWPVFSYRIRNTKPKANKTTVKIDRAEFEKLKSLKGTTFDWLRDGNRPDGTTGICKKHKIKCYVQCFATKKVDWSNAYCTHWSGWSKKTY